MGETIKIKYFTDKIDKLDYIDGVSDWIDLHAAEDVVLKKGEYKLISLGIAMELPEGYEAHVVPRSSTFKNYGIMTCGICRYMLHAIRKYTSMTGSASSAL